MNAIDPHVLQKCVYSSIKNAQVFLLKKKTHAKTINFKRRKCLRKRHIFDILMFLLTFWR